MIFVIECHTLTLKQLSLVRGQYNLVTFQKQFNLAVLPNCAALFCFRRTLEKLQMEVGEVHACSAHVRCTLNEALESESTFCIVCVFHH
jgi:hypothetical protein